MKKTIKTVMAWCVLIVLTVSTTLPALASETLKGVGDGAEQADTFFEQTEWIANDPSYKDFLTMCSGEVYKQEFLKIDGNSEELWESYSLYEKATYTLLFANPHMILMGGNAQSYTTDEAAFIKHLGQFIEPVLNKLDRGTEVYTALVDVWTWHYQNYTEKAIVINPFSEVVYSTSDAVQTGDDFVLTEEEQREFLSGEEPLQSDSTAPKSNNVGFIIALVFGSVAVGGGLILWLTQKKKSDNKNKQP